MPRTVAPCECNRVATACGDGGGRHARKGRVTVVEVEHIGAALVADDQVEQTVTTPIPPGADLSVAACGSATHGGEGARTVVFVQRVAGVEVHVCDVMGAQECVEVGAHATSTTRPSCCPCAR